MYLGIEIGGTKLQIGVSAADGPGWVTLENYPIDRRRGAVGILDQIEHAVSDLLRRFEIARIGVGFGGPVDSLAGRVIKSHQVDGWEGFELAAWLRGKFGLPARIGNDCDLAALAEARYGAGCGKNTVFYVTVGTGVGGGLVTGGRLHGAGRPAVAEIGHLRPGPAADRSDLTVEAIASGLGISAAARAFLRGEIPPAWRPLGWWEDGTAMRPDPWLGGQDSRSDLLQRAGGDPERITAKLVAEAAAAGNGAAAQVLLGACRVLGWAIAQVVTLLAPETVVVGGGVSLIGEEWFFQPLRGEVQRYVFPPLLHAYEIAPAALGESVVVRGAVALAAADAD